MSEDPKHIKFRNRKNPNTQFDLGMIQGIILLILQIMNAKKARFLRLEKIKFINLLKAMGSRAVCYFLQVNISDRRREFRFSNE